jgi:murein DD-endopeptidase MepM/ murein hydrolase activator NlpD
LKDWGARAAVYVTTVLLAAGALAVMRPLPERRAGDVLAPEPEPGVRERVDSLSSGETILDLLARNGISGGNAQAALGAASALDPRRLPAGMRVITQSVDQDSVPTGIVLQLAVDRLLHLTRTDSGWVEREERLPWVTDTMVVTGSIQSTLYDAIDDGAPDLPAPARAELAWSVADIFEYRVDMSRDLQKGDRFHVLFERATGPQGIVRIGRVLAADYASGRSHMAAIRLERDDGKASYYDQDGKSMQSMFLRAPLAFRRISSVFGMRKHPILGIWRAHTGTDYAANAGTPVRSVGDGVVIFAGRKGGYGNAIDVRHANGFVTRYGHLRGFAAGVHTGTRVGIGQTIAYVGSTGLATAPHLHFEVLVGGVQRNPRVALESKSGRPLAEQDRARFVSTRGEYLTLLERGSSHVAATNE